MTLNKLAGLAFGILCLTGCAADEVSPTTDMSTTTVPTPDISDKKSVVSESTDPLTPSKASINAAAERVKAYASQARNGSDADMAYDLAQKVERVKMMGSPQNSLTQLASLRDQAKPVFPEDAAIFDRIDTAIAWSHLVSAKPEDARAILQRLSPNQQTPEPTSDEHPADRDARLRLLRTDAMLKAETGARAEGLSDVRDLLELRDSELEPYEHADLLRIEATLMFYEGDRSGALVKYAEMINEMEMAVDSDNDRQIDMFISSLSSLGAIHAMTGDPEGAILYYERAAGLVRQYLPDAPQTEALILANLGDAFVQVGRHSEAESMIRRAIDIRRPELGDDHPQIGLSFLTLSQALSLQNKQEDAEATANQAYEILMKYQPVMRDMVPYALGAAASAAFRSGHAEKAEEYLRTLMAFRKDQDIEDVFGAGNDHLLFSDVHTALGNKELALEQAKLAQKNIRAHTSPGYHYDIMMDLYVEFTRSRLDPDFTLEKTRNYLEEIEADILAVSYGQSGWSDSARNHGRSQALIANIAVEQGATDLALKAMQIGNLTDIAEWEQRHRLKESLGDPASAGLHDTIRKTREQLAPTRRRLAKAILDEDVESASHIQSELSALRQTISETSERLSRSGSADLTTPLELLTEAQIRERLDPGEAVLFILPFHRPTAALVKPQGTVLVAQNDWDNVIINNFQAVSSRVKSGLTVSAADDDVKALGWMFNETEKAADMQAAMADLNSLYVVTSGIYTRFPLHLLPDPNKPGRFLGERLAVSHLPSVASLQKQDETHDSAPLRLLGIGDPNFGGNLMSLSAPIAVASVLGDLPIMRNGVAIRDSLSELPQLPATRDEINAVARAFGSDNATVKLGPDATEANLRALPLQDYDIIAFATHGLLPSDLPGLDGPALALTPPLEDTDDANRDGLLTAEEISMLDLNASLVMLSACNTAGNDLSFRPFSGLPQAFFAAGADAVLVSHWAVRDDTAAFLSAETTRGMAAGKSPPVALRDAMTALRRSDLPGADQPAIWAPFVVVGG